VKLSTGPGQNRIKFDLTPLIYAYKSIMEDETSNIEEALAIKWGEMKLNSNKMKSLIRIRFHLTPLVLFSDTFSQAEISFDDQ